ncbi:MAG: hypothetical protein KDB27_33545, partial [Planctomycetales bacterium]|nr:hypothetical protein [Planctomycetales bacterium]
TGYDAGLENPLLSGGGRVYYPLSDRRKIEQRGSTKVYDMFRDVEIQMNEIRETPEEHVMVFRPSMMEDFDGAFPQSTLCIHSQWRGYMKGDRWQEVESALDATNGRIVQAHTSGHASVSDIVKFAQAINTKTIIPVHTVAPEKFCEHFSNVVIATDGEPIHL